MICDAHTSQGTGIVLQRRFGPVGCEAKPAKRRLISHRWQRATPHCERKTLVSKQGLAHLVLEPAGHTAIKRHLAIREGNRHKNETHNTHNYLSERQGAINAIICATVAAWSNRNTIGRSNTQGVTPRDWLTWVTTCSSPIQSSKAR